MANEEHIKLIKQGVEKWNHWRDKSPQIIPDLSLGNLSGLNLSGVNLKFAHLRNADLKKTDLSQANVAHSNIGNANLSNADLTGSEMSCTRLVGAILVQSTLERAYLGHADLSEAILSQANLNEANLNSAKLQKADLKRAQLRYADLSQVNLTSANLSDANLEGADIQGANLSQADLSNAILRKAKMGWTTLVNNDLSSVQGLETVWHLGPSSIGIDTIYRSRGKISELFLRNAGVPDNFVLYMTSLTGEAIQYYSCFLSHSEPDGDFADRLRNDLISNNISCWHYRHDMRGGQFWRVQINEAIKVHEKLVLICSEKSLLRRNVVDEIITAMERERETGSQKLFPVRLDDFVLSNKMLEIADQRMNAGEWREDWVRYVRAYHIPDFRTWKNHDAYMLEFDNLLEALKNPAKRFTVAQTDGSRV